jgi:hypothetical protein
MRGRVLRVMGKGGKERMVPFGGHATSALADWRSHWGALRAVAEESSLTTAGRSDDPVFLNFRGGRLSDRSVRRIVDQRVRRSAGHPGAPRPLVPLHHSALHPPRDRTSAARLPRKPPSGAREEGRPGSSSKRQQRNDWRRLRCRGLGVPRSWDQRRNLVLSGPAKVMGRAQSTGELASLPGYFDSEYDFRSRSFR